MSQSNITFVTAFLNLKEDNTFLRRRTNEKYLLDFAPLANSGLNMIIFMSPDIIVEAIQLYPRLKFEPLTLEELDMYKVAHANPEKEYKGPKRSFPDRCTARCLIMQNAKTEIVKLAIEHPDYEKTTHYAWIDFGISQFLKPDPCVAIARLKEQVDTRQLKSPLMALPGVWGLGQYKELIAQDIMWRFCGSYFVGDVKSILEFHNLMETAFPQFLEKYNFITWEINIWVILELEYGWKPDWYPSNHHERIFLLPEHLLLAKK